MAGAQIHPSKPLMPYPGQRVAVFLDDQASGATLGYYGQFLGVPLTSLEHDPYRRSARVYRVLVPFLRRIIDVRPEDVFVCPSQEQTTEESPPAPLGSVRFSLPPADDNAEIKGFFRIGDRPWGHFFFLKTSRSHASYEYSAPVRGNEIGEGVLFYEVPRPQRLDRSYVLQALTEIMGGQKIWHVAGDSDD